MEEIKKIKEKLLFNLDAQLQNLRFRMGANLVINTASYERELDGIKRICHRIAQLHEIGNVLRTLDRKGINVPLD